MGRYFLALSVGLFGLRIAMIFALRQILGRRKVDMQCEKTSSSHANIGVPQLMTNSGAIRLGPCAFPLFSRFTAAAISFSMKTSVSVSSSAGLVLSDSQSRHSLPC